MFLKKNNTRLAQTEGSIRSSYGTFLIFLHGSSFDSRREMIRRCWRDFFLPRLFFLFFFFNHIFIPLLSFFFPPDMNYWTRGINRMSLFLQSCNTFDALFDLSIKILTVNKYSESPTRVCIISYGLLLLSGNYATAWSRQLDR